MFHRDTFRLIRKTGKRFVAILLIVLIGVGFMVGLMSSSPTMRASVDRYFDDYNFMDVQLYSACGFDEGDVAALAANDVVKDIFATKFTDVYVKNDESVIITRVQELESDINRFILLEGRMPQKPNEALALGSSSYGTVFSIGDKIELYLEEDDLSENLAVTEYEIVGTVKTPQYMSDSKETSTLNNLNLSTVIFVDNENFLSEYYTSLYLTIKGADEFDSFGDEYEQFIGEKLDELQKTIDIQEPVLKEKIIKEATEEIADGERELEEEVAEAEAEIADAKKELEDAYYRIMYGESQLQSGEKALKEGEKEISKNEKLLDKSEKELNAGKQQLAQQTGTTYEEAAANIKNFYGIYNMLKGMAANPEIPAGAAVSQVLAGQTAQVTTLQGYNQQLADGNTALESYNSQLEQQNSLLNEEIRRLTEENNSLSPDTEGYADIIAANNAKISENQTAVASNTETINQNKSTISRNNTLIEQNNTYIRQLSQVVTVLENMLTLFGDVPFAQLPAMIDGMFGGSMETAYQSVLTIEQGEIQIADGRQQLKKAKSKLSDSKKQLRDAAAELNEGRAEYEKGVKELADAEKELAEEVEEARIDIEKAKQDLAELPDAEWTVLDRESHYSTVMYSGNTDQMERIGNVFPMLFFLVAALVCMTTMKRLVDEERSQIGIFSALGFSKKQITGKYVIYALSASLIGSVVSIPLGVNIFPVVIYYCWRLTYDLPDMVLTMPAEIALLGVCSFTVLMVVVTIMVVHGVLKENPSRLMRPKAPRSAKKIFIEHIDFIWKRLSFTSKVTARNIIRYKSRFFMTVIGVAGCTSLLVLGFAIKGSISQVITLQYEDIINYDTTIRLEDDDYLAEIRNDLLEDERVNAVIPFMTYSSKVYFEDDDKAIQSYVMKAGEVHGAYDLRDRKTKDRIELEDGIVISEKFSRLHSLSVGDTLTVESEEGLKRKVPVTAICEMYTGHFMFMSDEFYTKTFGETVHFESIALSTTDSAAVIEAFEDAEGVKTISDFSETIATFTNMLDTLNIIIVVIILAAGSLALVVIMNLTEVNISERIREIATLKVLGFNNKEVYSYIFKEVFVLSLIGMILGLPLGKLELTYVMGIIDMEMVMFSTVVEAPSYAAGFVITLVFTVFVILLMRKTLRNVQMVESLKSVE